MIEFSLKSKTVPVCINEGINENFISNDEENVNDMFYFKWDNAKKEDYKLNLESEQFVDSLSELTSNVCNIDNCSNVDASLSSFISRCYHEFACHLAEAIQRLAAVCFKLTNSSSSQSR